MVENGVGRPSKYRPEMCDEIISLSDKGWPIVKIAHHWGVTESNIQDWVHGNLSFSPQFSIAYKRARGAYTAYILDKFEEGLFDSKDRRMNAIAARALGTYARLNMEDKPVSRSKIDSASHLDRMQAVLKMSANGDLTAKELKDMLESVAIAAKIENIAKLEEKVEMLEGLVKDLTNGINV